MGTTKKPRKKYRPKPILSNPLGYVLEIITVKDMEKALDVVRTKLRLGKDTVKLPPVPEHLK